MDIQTKYNLNDELFFMKENKIYKSYVYGIAYNISLGGGGNRYSKIMYNMNPYGEYSEEVLFKTKEELIKSL